MKRKRKASPGLTTDLGEYQLSRLHGKTIVRTEFLNKPLPNDPRGGSRDIVILHFADGTKVEIRNGAWGMGQDPDDPIDLAIDVHIFDADGKLESNLGFRQKKEDA